MSDQHAKYKRPSEQALCFACGTRFVRMLDEKPKCPYCGSESRTDVVPATEVNLMYLQSNRADPAIGAIKAGPDAVKCLETAAQALRDRAEIRDQPDGERSAARAAAIVTAWTGREVTESDVWRVLLAVKLSRSVQGKFHGDDYVDACGYMALLGECEAKLQ